jgi:glutamate 5-kinase
MGCQALRLQQRPPELAKRQALAAIGQGALMRIYTDFFAALSVVR